MPNVMFHLYFPEPTYSEQIIYDSFLDSIDGFQQYIAFLGGSITIGPDRVTLNTGGGAGGEAVLIKKLLYPRLTPSWAKRRSFKIRAYVAVANDTNPLNYINTGLEVPGGRGFGFMFHSTKIQGFTRNGTPETYLDLLTGLAPPWTRNDVWEAIFIPGSKVDFYISGVLKGTITTTLPTGTTTAENIARISVHAETAVTHQIQTSEIRVVQEE